jgi:hypothetical protein
VSNHGDVELVIAGDFSRSVRQRLSFSTLRRSKTSRQSCLTDHTQPDEELMLHPAVDALLAKCERSISAVWTATTEASGSAAIVVIQEIAAANLPS